MTESQLAIVERQEGDVTVLILSGQIVLDDGDLAFRRQVHELIDRGRVKIVVDLGGVTYIDSSGVGMIAAKLKTVRECGGDMKLVHVTSRSQRLLGVMKLLTVFETFEELDAAVRSFSWRSR
jgi:anti-sigma B factor antagonist